MRLPLPLPFVSLLLASLLPLASALLPTFNSGSGMTFCKCLCFSNSTIIPLYLPKDPIHPCLSCTKQFCLDQKLPACFGASSGDEDLDTGTGEEGDVEARCFRESALALVDLVLEPPLGTSTLMLNFVQNATHRNPTSSSSSSSSSPPFFSSVPFSRPMASTYRPSSNAEGSED